jgi:ankyrin repeat protein
MKWIFCWLVISAGSLQAGANTAVELLTKACRVGDMKMAESLLSFGVDPDVPDRYGATPLYYAASYNQFEIVQLLLAYHASPNAPIQMNRPKDDLYTPGSALQYAASLGNLRIISTLLAAGADINAKGAMGRTALHFAGTQVGVMHLLIERGADVNVRDGEGVAPLDAAVWNGSLDSVAILLAHGARLNEVEPETNATPINEAAYRGHSAIVQYLLQFKPDLGIPDKRGNTPLENAIRFRREDAALLLLEAEANAEKTPQFLAKIMEAAAKKDEAALVETLLRRGVPLNGALPSGSTPLETAAFAGAVKVVSTLVRNNADPNISGRNGTSPLESAALQGFDTIAAMLLDHGALVNYLNTGSGTTALYTAASFGRAKVVKLLLDHGANPSLCGSKQKSPYLAALENGNMEAAGLFQTYRGKEGCKP